VSTESRTPEEPPNSEQILGLAAIAGRSKPVNSMSNSFKVVNSSSRAASFASSHSPLILL
jgi:hypothetical protein